MNDQPDPAVEQEKPKPAKPEAPRTTTRTPPRNAMMPPPEVR